MSEQMNDWPCHKLDQKLWCDRRGPNGFMGHTCVVQEPEPLTRDELLVLLIEECGEVIQAATKCLRFGYESDHGVGYGKNDVVPSKECGDLKAVIDALPLARDHMELCRAGKIAKATLAKARFGIAQQTQDGKK